MRLGDKFPELDSHKVFNLRTDTCNCYKTNGAPVPLTKQKLMTTANQSPPFIEDGIFEGLGKAVMGKKAALNTRRRAPDGAPGSYSSTIQV